MKEYLNYALRTLFELVKIPTVNPPGENYERIAKFLQKELENIGFDTELIEVLEEYLDKTYPYSPQHKGKPRFIVYGKIGKGESLHFNGHYDVVPPGKGWRHNPFSPTIEGNKIYGRGTTDMKGGIATTLAALKYVVENNLINCKIEVAFVPDEESGGMGTKYLIEEVKVKPDYVIIPEPTSHRLIGIGHKGFARGIVRVIGRQGHASRPWKAVNAFEKACELVANFLPSYWNLLKNRKTCFPVEDENSAYPSIALGGYAESPAKKDNIIPGEFYFSFDRRIIPEEDAEEVVRELEEYLRNFASKVNVDIEIIVKSLIEASATPIESKIVQITKRAVKNVLGIEPTLMLNAGRYDLVYYRRVGVEGIAYGPGVGGQAHAVNEYTTVDEIEKVLNVYVEIIKLFGGVGHEG
ncbi:M20 family metallopeptidase [Thermococcus paralvinellae]|uniref:Probable succinyl-diaminopimelate desuccinylase n=1 Tax=Thermococcus paralvinellae TaxID=582419 RepID=W0I4L7_9EURY|nr:M20 family metallopeptidase [Thermococcus paralvinellae]AHF80989.1 Succinyl-diaminopimelate desuccinylase (dapE) [Thermococcus paralvinellae]